MKTIKEKQVDAFKTLKPHFGYKNTMQAPTIKKVVISSGVGSLNKDKKKVELIGERLARITGQKSALRTSKKSIAGFKSREGDSVGYQVTLRGDRMWNFLEKLVNIAIPRTKDFRGLNRTAVDDMGNFTIGIRENSIFPECSEEELKDVFGLAITLVTSVKDPKETIAFLEHLGFPLKKA
jgi:large subunit ribosomal protein L5